MSNATVSHFFIDKAKEAVEEWDGVSTPELLLAILLKTGEPPEVILTEALCRWEQRLRPSEE